MDRFAAQDCMIGASWIGQRVQSSEAFGQVKALSEQGEVSVRIRRLAQGLRDMWFLEVASHRRWPRFKSDSVSTLAYKNKGIEVRYGFDMQVECDFLWPESDQIPLQMV